MRLLHTSDWHLGASFHEQPRAEEQAHFLEWLLGAVEEHEVDALVVAGDVFDTANPPAEAQSLYYQFLAKLGARGGRGRGGAPRQVIVVGGNHDSPARLDAPREVLACLSATVVGGYDPERGGASRPEESALETACGVLVPLRNAAGEAVVVVAAVPFVSEYRLGARGFEASAEEQRASVHEVFRAAYTNLADRAEAAFPGARLVATGHLTVLARAGAKPSEEDAIPAEINRVGTLGALAPEVFDERFRYVALGHVHRGFSVDPAGRVRYSGTPLQVSAVEGASTRRVLLVDVEASEVKVTAVPVPQRRRLVTVAGTREEVLAALAQVRAAEGELPPYVVVEVFVEGPTPGVEAAVLARAKELGEGALTIARVVVRAVRREAEAGAAAALPPVEALTAEQAFRYAWARRYGEGSEVPEAVLQRFRRVVEQQAGAEVAS
jgi:exonuclease SbcD